MNCNYSSNLPPCYRLAIPLLSPCYPLASIPISTFTELTIHLIWLFLAYSLHIAYIYPAYTLALFCIYQKTKSPTFSTILNYTTNSNLATPEFHTSHTKLNCYIGNFMLRVVLFRSSTISLPLLTLPRTFRLAWMYLESSFILSTFFLSSSYLLSTFFLPSFYLLPTHYFVFTKGIFSVIIVRYESSMSQELSIFNSL